MTMVDYNRGLKRLEQSCSLTFELNHHHWPRLHLEPTDGDRSGCPGMIHDQHLPQASQKQAVKRTVSVVLMPEFDGVVQDHEDRRLEHSTTTKNDQSATAVFVATSKAESQQST